MSFTYDPAGLSKMLYKIRLKLGDTDENSYFLHDEEINLVISEKATFNTQIVECCNLICARVASDVNIHIANDKEDLEKLYERYTKMRDRFARLAAGSYPWMASITDSDKETYGNVGDTDLVKPAFSKGMDDNAE